MAATLLNSLASFTSVVAITGMLQLTDSNELFLLSLGVCLMLVVQLYHDLAQLLLIKFYIQVNLLLRVVLMALVVVVFKHLDLFKLYE